MENWMTRMQQWGADPAAAIARMLDDEEFYIGLLRRFIENRRWEVLEDAIEKDHYREAFEIAHDLKGNTAVLSLTPLHNTVSRVVDDLRMTEPLETLREDMEGFMREIASFEEIMENE